MNTLNEWWNRKGINLVADRFDIDDHFGSVVGYHNPNHRWNGWATPWFPIESVRIIQGRLDQGTKITIDDDGVWLWREDEIEDMTDPRGFLEESINVDGVRMWDIGQGGWCWYEDEVSA
jgi:hypothetical protein